MDTQYNLSNLEAGFKQYLVTVNKKPLNSITIKNYLSDFRHFCGWTRQEFKIQNLKFEIEGIQRITTETIEDYIEYQKQGNIPVKTINRRLSTLRKFGSFCISQGWMKENAAKRIKNYEIGFKNENGEILMEYQQYLVKQNLGRQNITNLIADVKEFINL